MKRERSEEALRRLGTLREISYGSRIGQAEKLREKLCQELERLWELGVRTEDLTAEERQRLVRKAWSRLG